VHAERTQRTVAVTGATGFIGRHVVSHLLAGGIGVRAIVRPTSVARLLQPVANPGGTPDRGAPHGPLEIVRAPLDQSALAEAFRHVDVVVHLAGVVSSLRRADYGDVNVDGTREVAEAARAAGARLVHISSLAAAGPASPAAPRTESDPSNPITPYGRSKLEGELAVAGMAGLRWTILRPGVVYGPGDRALLPLFRLARLGVLPLIGRPTAAFTFIHVTDAVRAIDAAIHIETDGETFFVGHPEPVTTRALLDGVRKSLGRKAAIVRVPALMTRAVAIAGDLGGLLTRRRMPMNGSRYLEVSAEGFVCRVDRLRERLGVVAQIDLREGLARTADWYRQEGWM
jgi:nucleoside-diphosphate-sugar epimerase